MTRAEAVVVARSYDRTPYILGARSKGIGVDCATLLGCYLIEIGAASQDLWKSLTPYSHDWFLHDSNERYLRGLVRFGFAAADDLCRTDAKAQPGDIVLFRCLSSKVFNHGAIVTTWPYGIHAEVHGVREANLTAHRLTAYRPMEVFDPFAKMEVEP
jgi:cell wall-associated NlpC family hydrolase